MTINTNAVWDDLRAPATGINPPGQVSDPDWDTTKLGWLFAAGTPELIHIIVQLPHEWAIGTELRPHVHWEKSTSAAGDVLWQIAYQWTGHGEARTAEATLSSATAVIASDVADIQQITPLGVIDGAGRSISDMLLIKLTRETGDVADTYGADARLLEFDLHYQSDSGGSSAEFVK